MLNKCVFETTHRGNKSSSLSWFYRRNILFKSASIYKVRDILIFPFVTHLTRRHHGKDCPKEAPRAARADSGLRSELVRRRRIDVVSKVDEVLAHSDFLKVCTKFAVLFKISHQWKDQISFHLKISGPRPLLPCLSKTLHDTWVAC